MKIVLDNGAYIPEKAHDTDAGYDLRTPTECWLYTGESIVIDTGYTCNFRSIQQA